MKKSFQRVIATLNLFQGKQSLPIFMLAAIFALSACDDSSSAGGDETGVSSSSVESPDSSVTLSGASAESNGSSNENMEKDKSSSSVKGSEPAEVFSSSAKETKNSSDSKSSSSVKSDDSSSSKKDVSSSSVNSSSSAKSSSSSSVKQSSSSVASSSSEYKPYNHQKVFSSDSLLSGAYKQFTDKRNGRIYFYLTINGKNQAGESASVTVMAENLNVGIDVSGAEDQSDDSKIERYCYNDDTTNCDKFGGLYQWAEAMQLPSECNTKSCADQIKPNHQGICPDGWRLLTYDDFYIVVHADGNVNPLVEGVRAIAFGGHNYSGYSLIGAGYNWNHTFKNLNEGTYWFYPEESVKNADVATYSTNQNKYSSGFSRNEVYKTHGFSVRCVKVD
ncbi:major paralogous domain-containing protein [Fibrobacter sp. UWT3]|uniref:FISUMP domain-containing protein n=1 Tax=Fibrobacter sp. UWT3 TaxID=1896225 RepID=UPI000BCEAF7E|nr:FISUMP domain-containing protein [Fibrobacter sp. UWT3]SOE50472.1 major paralogous domain-containing protein [Fibrobacter sp. UWT3]